MKRYNEYIQESLRDKMVGKSDEEFLAAVNNKSPFGARAIFMYGDEDGPFEVPQIIEDKVKEAEKELDDIFEKHPDHPNMPIHLDKLVEDVADYVDKYKGNKEHILQYGLSDLAAHLKEYAYSWRHDDYEEFYGAETVKTFMTLLKQMALDEVNYNNSDAPYMY